MVPRLVKRTYEVILASLVTATVVLVIVVANSMLLTRGTVSKGFETWLAFIQRPDILGTIILTALVTVTVLFLSRNQTVRR